jgi:hypothetical protein
MPSPFPGMDPYLEGRLWPDLHQALAAKLRQLLAPLVAPKYVARLEISIVHDTSPEKEAGIMYPDLEVLLEGGADLPLATGGSSLRDTAATQITPFTLTVPALPAMRVKLVSVQLRTVERDRLVTSIEILSPINKRRPGLSAYRRKRLTLIGEGVHLVELDLLRRGRRVVPGKGVPPCHYLLACTRAGLTHTELWPLSVRNQLPVLPVPLLKPDPDVALQLGDALAAVYDEARYDLSIDYASQPPPPEFAPAEADWIQTVTEAIR